MHSADLSPLRVHDLRHTAVALWIAAGANPKQIAIRAGHTSVSVVLDRYGHLFPEQDDALVCALERAAPTITPELRSPMRRVNLGRCLNTLP